MMEECKNHDEFWYEASRINLSEAICKRIKELNINTDELAKMVGCKNNSITRIMTGTSSFNFKLLVKIGRALKLELTFIDSLK